MVPDDCTTPALFTVGTTVEYEQAPLLHVSVVQELLSSQLIVSVKGVQETFEPPQDGGV